MWLWATALGGRWSFCCALVKSNNSGLDNQGTCTWSSTESQTHYVTPRSQPLLS